MSIIRNFLFLTTIFLAQFLQAQQCNADFLFADDGLTITFTDISTSQTGDPIISWFWDFDDGGSTSDEQNPVYTFSDGDEFLVCLTITAQSGCTNEVCINVSICTLNISADVGDLCDGNDNISVNVTISDPFDQAKDVNVFLDGNLIPGSPFNIEDVDPVILNLTVPGDGLNHTIFAQSTDVGHCNVEFTFQTIDCGSGCFLSGMNVSLSGGSTSIVEVGDNFFNPVNTTITIGDLVQFQWVGDGHSTTSDATSGPDSWNSGVIGMGSTYDVVITNPGIHPFYCIPHGGPNGQGMSGQIIGNCPPSNSFDVLVSFQTSQAGPQGYNLLIDGIIQSGSPFQYSGIGTNSQTVQLSGDGLSHTFVIEDVATPSCSSTRIFQAPDCGAAPACSISVEAVQNGGCDAANEVPVQLTVNSINGGNAGFNVSVDGNFVAGPVSYDASGTNLVDISIIGDEQSHMISVADVNDAACQGSVDLITQNCLITCNLTNLVLTTGSSFTHMVEVQDFQFSPENIMISSGDIVQFVWTGSVAHTSTSDAETGSDSWDSGLLNDGSTFNSPILTEGVHPYYCIPHGGPGGVGMSGSITVQADCSNGEVPVQLTFDEVGGGFAGYQILIDGNTAPGGPFLYDPSGTNSQSILVPGDGMFHTITVQDVENITCGITNNIETADCNASTCQLGVVALETGNCNGMSVDVNVMVSDVGGGPAGFRIMLDGSLQGNYSYDPSGETTVTIQVAGDGLSHNILITDLTDLGCQASTALTTTDCSIPCVLLNLSLSTGSEMTHIVSVQDFAFSPKHIVITSGDVVEFQWTGQVAHTSTSDLASGADSWDSGLLEFGSTFTSPVLSEGVHPYFCTPHGGPGGIGMSGTITVQADCENGLVAVQVNFSEQGGSGDGYHIKVDGILDTNGPFAYDLSGLNSITVLIPGDGNSHTITIEDAIFSTCSVEAAILTPDCNASICQLSLATPEIGPCIDGQVAVNLTVSEVGGGAGGFNLMVDGVSQGNFQYDPSGLSMISIQLTGDGTTHEILVVDALDTVCLSATIVSILDCSATCELSGLTVDFGNAAMHIVEVLDFEFSPANLQVSVGDTVRFIWTGQVQHTSTSDAESGPLFWDSELLGNGAVYDVVVTQAGIHPYYCIPHGDPGGIGMSGSITAIADCENGQVSATVSFQDMGGSGQGFNIFVDSILLGGSPFVYEAGGIQNKTILLSGDGQMHFIEVADVSDSNCNISLNIATPDCNASTCQLSLLTPSIGNCQEGQVPLEISLVSSGVSNSLFSLLVDGIIQQGSPFQYDVTDTTVLSLLLPGDGQNHTIFILDAMDVGCSVSIEVSVPDCSQSCQISDFSIDFGLPMVHVVEVRDFEFFPVNTTIALGDTVRFIWTGVVAHTTTSDTIDGPDFWASDLFGQGAQFDVVITSEGTHPYYCIPHGGPGGIGMSGIINVVNPCNDQTLPAQICFVSSGGSVSGFELLIDGNTVSGGPFLYDTGITCISAIVPADGSMHTFTIQDIVDQNCIMNTSILTPDCDDPCLNFAAGFDYIIDPDQMQVSFINTSSPSSDSLFWRFGDGTTSNEINPNHSYGNDGIFTVCLEAYQSNTCADTNCVEIDLSAIICNVDFDYTLNGLEVSFANTSVLSDSAYTTLWTFGDGQTSTDSNPIHTYSSIGDYNACLTITSASCDTTFCRNIDLSDPCLLLTADIGIDIEGGTVQFQDLSTGNPQSWLWGFGDGITSSLQNPVHSYSASGDYSICLLIFDFENNCTDFFCTDITIISTSIDEHLKRQPLIFYPNPVSGRDFTVTVRDIQPSLIGDISSILFRMDGRQIGQMEAKYLDPNLLQLQMTKEVAPGYYLVRLISGGKILNGKIIVH